METCARCGHLRSEHITQWEPREGEPYPGDCTACSCPRFQSQAERMSGVALENQAYHDKHRESFIEFRVTFGWGQPHGPYSKSGAYPGDPWGHYSTIWAPDQSTAASMARTRYGNIYSFLYHPMDWCNWGPEMGEIKELEVLQFWALSLLQPWPEVGGLHRGAHLGTGI